MKEEGFKNLPRDLFGPLGKRADRKDQKPLICGPQSFPNDLDGHGVTNFAQCDNNGFCEFDIIKIEYFNQIGDCLSVFEETNKVNGQ